MFLREDLLSLYLLSCRTKRPAGSGGSSNTTQITDEEGMEKGDETEDYKKWREEEQMELMDFE